MRTGNCRPLRMAAAAQRPGSERSVVPRQALVPVIGALLMIPGLALPAQGQPAELFACDPWCREGRGAIMLDCLDPGPALLFAEIVGRAWWGPLTWQGPIQISIQARPVALLETIPLYIELRPDDDTARNCIPIGGNAIRWQTLGVGGSCDSLWVHSDPIDVPLEQGTRYWVQATGFWVMDGRNPVASSPFVRCIWIRRATDAVVSWSWSRVKALYR